MINFEFIQSHYVENLFTAALKVQKYQIIQWLLLASNSIQNHELRKFLGLWDTGYHKTLESHGWELLGC